MKRILLVSCGGLGHGGVQSVIMNIVRGLSNKYIFDIVLFTSERRYYDDEFESYGGKIFRVPHYEGKIWIRKKIDYYVRWMSISPNIKKIVIENGPYVAIHCNNVFESGICLKSVRKLVPIRVCHAHVKAESGNPILRRLNNLYRSYILNYATDLIGCSEEANKSIFGNANNCVIIYNPYDDRRFDPKKYSISKRKSPRLIQIGYFCNNKNQCFSIEVFSLIQQIYQDAELIFIGFDSENYLDKMKKKIEEKKLTDNVKFYPQDADSPKLLSESDALLLPSYKEGFGIVLVEAQAMGVRCYVSNTVPKLANMGNCTYISLEDGAIKWADTIVDDLKHKKERNYVDCSAFGLNSFLDKIDYIYARGII